MTRLWIVASALMLSAVSASAQLAPPVIPGASNEATAAIEAPQPTVNEPAVVPETAAPPVAQDMTTKRHGCHGAEVSSQPLTN